MTGFFIKKAFFDGWDNLIGMVVLNLGFLAILLGGIYSMTLLGESAGLAMVLIIIALGLFSFYSAGSAHLTWGWAAYERGGWAAFVRGLRISWRHALLFWLLLALDGSLLLFVIPFYLSYGTIVGTLLSVVLFWLFIALEGDEEPEEHYTQQGTDNGAVAEVEGDDEQQEGTVQGEEQPEEQRMAPTDAEAPHKRCPASPLIGRPPPGQVGAAGAVEGEEAEGDDYEDHREARRLAEQSHAVDAPEEDGKETKIEDNHADEVVPPIEERLFDEESSHE